MKKTTPFYEAAILIAEGKSPCACWAIEDVLENPITIESNFFTETFEPTKEERNEYLRFNYSTAYWLHNPDGTNNDRIIALLFADLLWQDLNK